MKESKIVIKNENGIHARPAGYIVKKATQYKSIISIIKNTKSGNAKSIMSIMSMVLLDGDEIIIRAEGEDESLAVDALVKLFESMVKVE
jgi:phosphocarrier protein HPr